MKRTNQYAQTLPFGTTGCLVVLSGGMDSAIAARLCVHRYTKTKVHALSLFYNQKQSIELDKAAEVVEALGLASHKLIDISFLGEISKGISANVRDGMSMPTIQDILGDPSPPTQVPFRNSILFMIAAAYAETRGFDLIVTGLQAQDEYAYWDTTPSFVTAINNVMVQNRQHTIQLVAPWSGVNKATEIRVLNELDGNIDLLSHTITCYNPNDAGESCGVCPSCSERIANLTRAGFKDPIPYSKTIPWYQLIERSLELRKGLEEND